ncbi:bouquet formation protein Bqt1 [Schizosaccharomyces osmophilus]|uniref:Bouquet formation protein Bqt1 n=1 Tax=Schizosaccharomyces osmophilus TaxID=2545709 RepID=A0AAF0AU82_9SCHI|nr:bouquet formation protein Bqt1 [Schizosaccharomyces osmophilus]WBW71088.1 bouquet formation protein Bqt1 [Schizosaccharomyces osmophilus]
MYFLTTTLIAYEQDGEKYLTQIAIYTQIPVCTDPSCKDAQFLKRTLLQITFNGIQQLYTTFPNIWHYALLSKGKKEESLISVEEVPNSEFRIHYYILPWTRRLRGYQTITVQNEIRVPLIKRSEKWRILVEC